MCPTCGICIESLVRHQQAPPVATLCGHVFHAHCLGQWCESKGGEASCPQCRMPVRDEDLRVIFLDSHREHRRRHRRAKEEAKAATSNDTDAAVEESAENATQQAGASADGRSPSPSENERWVFPPEAATLLDRAMVFVSEVNSLGREAAQKIKLGIQLIEEELKNVTETIRLGSCG